MDRDMLSELTKLMPEDIVSAVPKRKKHVARRFCAMCARIDLRKAFDDKSGGIELGPRSTWRPDECDLCDFFLRNLPRVPQGRSGALPVSSSCLSSTEATEQVSLSAPESAQVIFQPTSRKYLGFGISSLAFDRDCQCHYALGSDLDGHFPNAAILVRSNHDLSSRMRVTTPMVDFNLIKAWLQEIPVQDNEDPELEAENDPSLLGLEASNATWLDVIDCISRSLVRLPSYTTARYVTLSYVWGSPSGLHIIDNHLSDLPLTIEDSITVCQKLGHKYLWVDRYCIPQNDILERHRQVKQMGDIYRNSALTIVACAGSNPQYGLPGVSHPRTSHSNILIKDVGYIQQIPATTDILVSAWAERGWTYQEALLSQARLYFTDRQVYYEDEESVECEVNTMAGVKVPDVSEWGSFSIHSRMAWSNSPMDVYKCIRYFSTRVLSFPSDAIDALQGIFATFEQDFQIRQVCGMAFATTQRLEVVPTVQYSLLFNTDHDSTRCNTFPSWSWAGWTGRKWWSFGRWPRNDIHDIFFEVAVELASGHTISWREFQIRYDTLSLQSVSSIKFIYIQVYLVLILGCTQPTDSNALDGSIYLQDGLCFRTPLLTDLKHIADMGNIEECALLRFFCPFDSFSVPHLVMRKKGTHWERINKIDGCYMDRNEFVDPSLWPGVLQTIRMG